MPERPMTALNVLGKPPAVERSASRTPGKPPLDLANPHSQDFLANPFAAIP